MRDSLSTAPDKAAPVWVQPELVGPTGVTPLSALQPVDPSGIREEGDATALRVKMNSVVVYDIAGGDVSALVPDGGVFGATCVVDDLAQAFLDDPRPEPLPGHARYYVVRAEKNNCGTSTYGFDSSGVVERVPTDDCP